MTAGAAHVWLPGFFTGRRHAVLDVHHGMTFHGVRLVWSVCGRAAVVDPDQSGSGLCDRCVLLAGPPPVLDRVIVPANESTPEGCVTEANAPRRSPFSGPYRRC